MRRAKGNQMKTVSSKASSIGSTAKRYASRAALTLTLLAVPHIGHAQGIVRGAQEGGYEGDRVAGLIGGVVGVAVGAGVGGAVGAVDGVLGIPDRYSYRCRGFYDRYDHFHCYR
jgi:hypothetical protein